MTTTRLTSLEVLDTDLTAALRAGVYGRQSHGKASSVEDQDRKNEAVCVDNKWPIGERRYADLVSASRFGTKERGDWSKLVADVAAGLLDVVVMWDVSRGDRTIESWAAFVSTCRAQGILIHATSHARTYDPRVPRDWKVLMDEGVDAAYDSEKKSTDVRRGVEGAAIAGKGHGPAAWGYTRTYNQEDRRKFTQVPNYDAPIVREIIEAIAKRVPIITIQRDLNKRRIPSPASRIPEILPWSRTTVRAVATRAAYAGLRTHNGTVSEANWAPIVDREIWYTAQAVLSEPDRKTTAPGWYKYLLAYLARAVCGAHLQGSPSSRPGGRVSYRCTAHGCTTVGLIELDEYVTRAVLARLALPDARGLFERSTADATAARAELAKHTHDLEEARASYAKPVGGISLETMARRETALAPLIRQAEARVVDAAAPTAGLALIGDGNFTTRTARPRWDALSIPAKRGVIARLLSEIKVGPAGERLHRRSSDEDRLRLAHERTTLAWRE